MSNHIAPSSRSPIVLVGVGEMGGVFARALLRDDHPIYPVTRSTPIADVVAEVPEPKMALVAVGESDLQPVLDVLPPAWKMRAGLIQNELLPRDWIASGIEHPTVAVVWFEKKPGADVKVIIPSPIGGPAAGLLISALETIGIPALAVDGEQLDWELVRKNLYILTANIAGLVTAGTVGSLWEDHRELAQRVATEVLDVQEWLVGRPLDRNGLLDGLAEAFAADPDHGATGRSAPSRLERALRHAALAGLDVPTIASIGHDHLPPPSL